MIKGGVFLIHKVQDLQTWLGFIEDVYVIDTWIEPHDVLKLTLRVLWWLTTHS